jgi:hypothetical protein
MLTVLLALAVHPVLRILIGLANYLEVDWYPTSLVENVHAMVPGAVEERRLDDEAAARAAFIIWTLIMMCIYIGIPIAIYIVLAMLYKQNVTDKRSPFTGPVAEAEKVKFNSTDVNQLCACCPCMTPPGDCKLCLYSFFCYDCRVADTFQASGVGVYWWVVAVFMIEWVAMQVINMLYAILMWSISASGSNEGGGPGWWIAGLVVAFWLASKRKEYRQKCGVGDAYGMDICCYWCCPFCLFYNDAYVLDTTQGVEVNCPWTLSSKGAPPAAAAPATVVGTAVAAPVVQGTEVKPSNQT